MCNFVTYFVCAILCIFMFLCDILLPSGVINDDSYYGTLIGSRMRSIEWCHFL